jgi:hypothetical protein
LLARVARDVRRNFADYEILALHKAHPHALGQKDPGRAVQRCIDKAGSEKSKATSAEIREREPIELIRCTRTELLLPIAEELYLILGKVPVEAYTLIAGALGSYKTFLLMCLCIQRASGIDLLSGFFRRGTSTDRAGSAADVRGQRPAHL